MSRKSMLGPLCALHNNTSETSAILSFNVLVSDVECSLLLGAVLDDKFSKGGNRIK